MYYTKHPFLKVGLPFLAATLIGTAILVDIRKSRYESMSMRRGGIKGIDEDSKDIGGKRSMKSLEEELEEWERNHRERIMRRDYEMKPVQGKGNGSESK